MGRSIEAKIFYGVCLNPGYDCEDEDEEDEEVEGEEVLTDPTLIDMLKKRFPDFDGYSSGIDSIEGASDLLEIELVGYDDDLREYLVLKSSNKSRCPGDEELVIPPELLSQSSDQPFREFFDLAGLPYVQPHWYMGCLYF